MNGKYFLDTNIFVYCFDEVNSFKRKRAQSLVQEALNSEKGVISFQIVQEFFNLATKKFPVKPPINELIDYLNLILMPMCIIYPTQNIYQQALYHHYIDGIPFYDALVLSAAIEADCHTLYSEDLQHGRVISGVKIQNPFEIKAFKSI